MDAESGLLLREERLQTDKRMQIKAFSSALIEFERAFDYHELAADLRLLEDKVMVLTLIAKVKTIKESFRVPKVQVRFFNVPFVGIMGA